jgi:hypothetical protein
MYPIRSILPLHRNKTVTPCLLLAGEERSNGRCALTPGASGDINLSLRAKYPHRLGAHQTIQNVFQICRCYLRNMDIFVYDV